MCTSSREGYQADRGEGRERREWGEGGGGLLKQGVDARRTSARYHANAAESSDFNRLETETDTELRPSELETGD